MRGWIQPLHDSAHIRAWHADAADRGFALGDVQEDAAAALGEARLISSSYATG